MEEVSPANRPRIAIGLANTRDRTLLRDALEWATVEPIEGSIPEGTDLCIVDDDHYRPLEAKLQDWKDAEKPLFSPVVVFLKGEVDSVWRAGASISADSVLKVPTSERLIRNDVRTLLETRETTRRLESERRLNEQIFERSPIAKTLLNPDGTIRRANERAEEILGLDHPSITGLTYDAPDWKITDSDGEPVPSDELPFSKVMETGESVYGEEHRIERPSGESVHLRINMAPIRDVDGSITQLVGAIEDVTAEKTLEARLRRSEKLHRTVLQSITDTVVLANEGGAFTYVCPNVDFIFGYSEEEVWELGTVEALFGSDPAAAMDQDQAVLENVELTVTDKSGAEHVTLITVREVSIGEGSRLYTARDITKRKGLEEQRQFYEQAIQSSDDLLAAVDGEENFLFANDAYCSFHGLEASEVEGRALSAVLGEEVYRKAASRVKRALEGETVQYESHRVHRTKGKRTLDIRYYPLQGEVGDVHGVVTSMRDITEQKNLEGAITEQRDRYESLFRSIRDAILVEDTDRRVVNCNPAFTALFGYSLEEIRGERTEVIYESSEEFEKLGKALSRQAMPGESLVTVHYRTKSGSTFPGETSLFPLKNQSGAVVGFIGLIRDVSERLERLQQLQNVDRLLRHNINNELTVINGFATLLKPEGGAVAEKALKIERAGRKLLQWAEKERQITRVLTEQTDPIRIDLARLLDRIRDRIASSHPEAAIEVRQGEPRSVSAIPEIESALFEIVENGIVHSESAEPTIRITVRGADERVEISVEDDGPAIPDLEIDALEALISVGPLKHG
ncbi:MAG: PAS domain S-box protein, partial [Halodesulfurarchaeum sp.]